MISLLWLWVAGIVGECAILWAVGVLIRLALARLGRPRAAVRRRPDGVWANPPVAVLDKSTTGQLLASRLRREPNLNVAPSTGNLPDADPRSGPIGRDGLWDRDIDG